jgi:predicted transcriptional regulator
MENKTTTKKVRKKTQTIIGTQRYINADTGEILETTVIEKEVERDFNFHKIWLNDLMSVLNLIGGKKLDILKYLLSEMRTQDNTISVTYTKIQEKLNTSRKTIAETMKILQEANFITKVQNGLYMVNPDVIVKGNGKKRDALMIKYVETKNEPTTTQTNS